MGRTSRFALTRRRQFLKGVAATGSLLTAPAIITTPIRRPRAAAQPGTIRVLAGPTVALEDWSVFERETGLKMDFEPFHVDDVGALYHEVMANEIGERIDIISVLAGVHKGLVEEGWVMPLDTSKMPNYAGISEDIRRNPLLYAGDDKDWGIPIYMNADSFGYFPEQLELPRPPEGLSWDLLLNSEDTLGRCAIDGQYLTLMYGGMYLKTRGMAEIGDPANMSPSEAEVATDFLIERKQAGQFRTLWETYDDQVANFVNQEALVQRCWEPAVHEARRQGVDVEYAYCDDFYVHWMHASFIPIQAQDRENLDEIYQALNWFMDGSYAAELAVLRGYAASRPDLGLAYARENDWSEEEIGRVKENLDKIERKFSNPNFWITGLPDELEAHEFHMARFKAA
jgi:putative spermidine/putrescine transport system substrate-binding protein